MPMVKTNPISRIKYGITHFSHSLYNPVEYHVHFKALKDTMMTKASDRVKQIDIKGVLIDSRHQLVLLVTCEKRFHLKMMPVVFVK